jgi:hypothetical protein
MHGPAVTKPCRDVAQKDTVAPAALALNRSRLVLD